MKKIVFVPLDERPCTYNYPIMLASMTSNINFVSIDKQYMGDIKKPGNIKKIQESLYNQCKDANYAIIAIDTLLYGGIVPSRLHYDDEKTLLDRLNFLRTLKKINPNLTIYAYHLIMRCPSGSGDSEEPNYYALCGKEIHEIGYYKHLSEIRPLNEKEQQIYDSDIKFIEDNNYQQYVDDYLARRKINALMNIHTLELVKDNIIDFLVIPQDDSAPYGLTAKDQMIVRKQIEEKNLQLKVLMYPDADAVGNTLLARVINRINNTTPKVYVRYSSCNNGNIIPLYEDRPVSESIKYQILAAGGIMSFDYTNSDIVLMVNLPLKNMLEARHLYDLNFKETSLDYSVGRNLVEYVEYIKYLVSINKCVAVADIAYANGADSVLFNLLKNEDLLFKVNSYAGWNTAANTLGTCLPLAMINKIYGNSKQFYDFLALRYVEDVGYMADVRFAAYDKFKDRFLWKEIDGKENGEVATYIRNNLISWINNNLVNDKYETKLVKHQQPWNRFFETEVKVEVKFK